MSGEREGKSKEAKMTQVERSQCDVKRKVMGFTYSLVLHL